MPERKIGRRTALKFIESVAIGTVIGVSACVPNLPGTLLQFAAYGIETKAIAAARKQLEDKYDIEIESGGWDTSRLDFTDKALEVLPVYFHEKGTSGKRYGLSLKSFISRCCMSTSTAEVVRLNPVDYNPYYDRVAALGDITHETVHRITPGLIDQGWPTTWQPVIEDMVGQPFVQFAIDTDARINAQIQSADPNQKDFLWRARYGVVNIRSGGRGGHIWVRTNANEFIAVMGETYVKGAQYFRDNYAMIVGQDLAVGLFGFCRDKIFRGKVYEKFPLAA